MTKEEARELLELFYEVKLPVVDRVISSNTSEKSIETWTFKGLMCIAYDLEEKDLINGKA